MEKHHIVFQVALPGAGSWENSKIVYVLEDCLPEYDCTDVADAISAVVGNITVRYTRFSPGEEITLAAALKKNGGYHQSHCTHNYK